MHEKNKKPIIYDSAADCIEVLIKEFSRKPFVKAAKRMPPYVIVIAGRSCSGKTRFAKLLEKALRKFLGANRLSLDNYYKDIDDPSGRDDQGNVNFDHKGAYHRGEFLRDVELLLGRVGVLEPEYSIDRNRRIPGRGTIIVPEDVIIIEGLYAIDFLSGIQADMIRIFIDVDETLQLQRLIDRNIRKGIGIPLIKEVFATRIYPGQTRFLDSQRSDADMIVNSKGGRTLINLGNNYDGEKKDPYQILAELKAYHNEIFGYKYPEYIFGELKGNKKEKKDALGKKYLSLIGMYNVDVYFHYQVKEIEVCATKIAAIINSLRDTAKERIENDTYGKLQYSNHSVQRYIVEGGSSPYEVEEQLVAGDIANIYLARNLTTFEEVYLKIAQDPVNNDLLERETYFLGDLRSTPPHPYVPVIVESFELRDGRMCNVLKYFRNMVSFAAVKEKYHDGIPLEHAFWIMDRILHEMAFVHSKNIVHGKIEPANIFIDPVGHDIYIPDFYFCVRETDTYVGRTDYSAPEISKTTRPHPTSDLYSVGLCMLELMGGDVENKKFREIKTLGAVSDQDKEKVETLILSFLNHRPGSRAEDAGNESKKLYKLRKSIFGEPEYIPLDM